MEEKYLLYLALAYYGIAFLAYAAVAQRVDNIGAAAGRLVYHILAFVAAEKFARKNDLIVIEIAENTFRVVEIHGDFAERLRLSLLGAVEYDVLHVSAAQRLGRLLAERETY